MSRADEKKTKWLLYSETILTKRLLHAEKQTILQF